MSSKIRTDKIRTFFVIAFIALGLYASAQTVTYQDIVNHVSAKDLTGKKAGDNITAYTASDGITYKVGSTITYGYPTNGKYYLYFRDVTSSVLGTLAEDENTSAAQTAVNQEIYERVENRSGGVATIKKIQCVPIDPFNKKTSGCKIYLVLNRGGIACTNFEEAIAVGEVQTKMNDSDAAINELKKWKEKLDLQIITQEEYDAKKKELMQYIK